MRDSEAEAQKELARITDVRQSARGYANYQQWITGSNLEQKISLEDYSVSNRGLALRPRRYSRSRSANGWKSSVTLSVSTSYCCSPSPQLEEMERFAEQVIRHPSTN